jgi:hypothetical protein
MAYTVENFPSKVAVKRALAAHKNGERGPIEVFQPGPFGPEVKDGTAAFEGPHYPQAHRWYGSGVVKDGLLLSIK